MLRALPLDLKIMKTQLRIKEFVKYFGIENVYVSFSGGKDSTVLLDIARKIYPDIEAVFVNTGLEFPDNIKLAKNTDNVTIIRPKFTFKEVIIKYGYPIVSKEVSKHAYGARTSKKEKPRQNYINRFNGLGNDGGDKNKEFNQQFIKYKPLLEAPFIISNRCCLQIKENPINSIKKYPIIGTMTEESFQRKQGWLKTGCNVFEGSKSSIKSKPISFWTEQNILEYIYTYNLEISNVYGGIIKDDNGKLHTTGCKRTGCVACGFGAHLEKESRFHLLYKTNPKLYNYCINGGAFDEDGLWKPNKDGLGFGFVFDWCNENINNFNIDYKIK